MSDESENYVPSDCKYHYWDSWVVRGRAPETLQERIDLAIAIARHGNTTDGSHHKNHYFDELVRVLLGCPLETKNATDVNGKPYSYQSLGKNDAYRAFVADLEADDYEWDEGIPA